MSRTLQIVVRNIPWLCSSCVTKKIVKNYNKILLTEREREREVGDGT
jgi:hypothetical protein